MESNLVYIALLLFLSLISFIVSFLTTWYVVRKAPRVGMTGKDMHKESLPEVAEMGGLGVVAGIVSGLYALVFFDTFFLDVVDSQKVILVVSVVLVACIIGIIDDVFDLPQWLKALIPLFIASPLMVSSSYGETTIFIPLLGDVNFGIIYYWILVPLAIAVCSNLTNMLAGFNGLEGSLSFVIFLSLMFIGFVYGRVEQGVIMLISAFAILGFLYFNRYPARVFPGDVGTFTFGSLIASSVIIGNIESAGVLMLVLFYIDFFLKFLAGFPKSFAVVKNDVLYAPENKVRGLADLVLKFTGGLKEKYLVAFLVFLQIVVSAIVVIYFMLRLYYF